MFHFFSKRALSFKSLNQPIKPRLPLTTIGQNLAKSIIENDIHSFKQILPQVKNTLFYDDSNAKEPNLYNALFIAAQHGRDEVVETLINECGLEIDIKDNAGDTLYQQAVRNGHPKTAALLSSLHEQQLEQKTLNKGFH